MIPHTESAAPDGMHAWSSRADDDPFCVTFFDNWFARTKTEADCTLRSLACTIKAATADHKDDLRWLKLGRFGGTATKTGCLRNNENLIAIGGIEADYDGTDVAYITFDEAVDILRQHGVRALVYTSPSHSEDAHRYRIICPCSEELSPDRRTPLLGRLNGLMRGTLSHESFTLSQSYYYGSVRENPSHRVETISGTPIDLLGRLDAKAVVPKPKPKPDPEARASGAFKRLSEKRIDGFVRACLDRVRAAPDGQKHHTLRDMARSIGGIQAEAGFSTEEAVGWLMAALPASVENWNRARKTASDSLEYGRAEPVVLEDRPHPKTNGTGHTEANGFDTGTEDGWGGWPGPDPAEMHAREGAEPEPDPEPPPPSFWDPFDEPKPPEFPRGVLSWGMEQTVFALARRDGVDPGAQAMAYLAAGSGAAHKAARFFPYANSDWGVPAILWVMLLALSGQRKTPVINNAFNPLRARDREAWAEYSKQKKAWEALPKDEQKKTPEPEEPHTVCVGDVTIEKLQIDLARSGRGAILVRDELADLLGFGAYSPAHAAKERAYYLQAYEGGTYHVGRVGRGTVFIEENALSLYGAIPPARLADFKDLDSDGFMQRMCVVRAAESASADPDVKVEHRLEIDGALSRLTQQTFGRQYFTEGGELIRETEQFGVKLASISDYGLGFQGFCSKLHGLHARLALVLHLLDNPDETMVPVETVMRAKRLLREYLLPQTLDFYSSFSKSGINRQRDVASWILTRAKDRFVASDLTAAMKWCRNLTTKQMNEMLEPLVNGGWLTPEEPWPQINRGWKVTPGLGQAFAERASTETRRRAEVRDLIARAKGSP